MPLKDIFKGKQRYVTVRPSSVKKDIPDGLWMKCTKCNQIIYNKELGNNLKVCGKCGFHFKLSVSERRTITFDEGSFVEYDAGIMPCNPLEFPGYDDKLKKSERATGLTEAVVTGEGRIGGYPVVVGMMDFGFIGASMGSVVGEKVTRAMERALAKRFPVLMITSSGGARMHEGILSLMQMAKTSAAVAKLAEACLLYICLLTNPTTAGVFASFASLGDIVLAEPDALIGFAGPRVIEETIRQKLPVGFQTSEFALKHGLIDGIVVRKDIRRTLTRILALHARQGEPV